MSGPRILVVDDENGIRRTLRAYLEDNGYRANAKSYEHRLNALPEHELQHIAHLRSERHAYADLAGALSHEVSDDAVNAHRCEQQRQGSEGGKQ